MISSERFAVGHRVLRRHFDLSQNKSLRTLEITATSIIAAGQDDATGPNTIASNFLQIVLSSITSPVPLDIVVIYQYSDLYGLLPCLVCKSGDICLHSMSAAADYRRQDLKQQLRVFREMYSVRDFRLVLCVDVPDCFVEIAVDILEKIVNGEIFQNPLIISERRTLHTRKSDWDVGSSTGASVIACAL